MLHAVDADMWPVKVQYNYLKEKKSLDNFLKLSGVKKKKKLQQMVLQIPSTVLSSFDAYKSSKYAAAKGGFKKYIICDWTSNRYWTENLVGNYWK